MRLFIIFASLFIHIFISSCHKKNINDSKDLILGNWKSSNPNDYPDINIVDSFRYMAILRDGKEIDSLQMRYKIDNQYFYIYAGALLASENKILKLSTDSFIYFRPEDKDTFSFSKNK